MGLGLGVEAASEIGSVSFKETWAVPRVLLVVLVDAAGSKDGAVNALEEAAVGQIKGSDDIGSHGILLVILTPVDIRATGAASGVENMGGLDAVELFEDLLAVLHANGGGVNLLALSLEDRLEMAGHPALAAPDQETVGCLGPIGAIGAVGAVRRHVESWPVGRIGRSGGAVEGNWSKGIDDEESRVRGCRQVRKENLCEKREGGTYIYEEYKLDQMVNRVPNGTGKGDSVMANAVCRLPRFSSAST